MTSIRNTCVAGAAALAEQSIAEAPLLLLNIVIAACQWPTPDKWLMRFLRTLEEHTKDRQDRGGPSPERITAEVKAAWQDLQPDVQNRLLDVTKESPGAYQDLVTLVGPLPEPTNPVVPARPEPMVDGIIPPTIPAARHALALMERDLNKAKTCEEIRKIEREAEALQALFREVNEIRSRTGRIIVLANYRIGKELEKAPVAKGGGDQKSDHRHSKKAGDPPSLKEQVGSKNRGLRLKNLAKHPKPAVEKAVQKIALAGKDVTVNAVLKALAADEPAKRGVSHANGERKKGATDADLLALFKDSIDIINESAPANGKPAEIPPVQHNAPIVGGPTIAQCVNQVRAIVREALDELQGDEVDCLFAALVDALASMNDARRAVQTDAHHHDEPARDATDTKAANDARPPQAPRRARCPGRPRGGRGTPSSQ